MHQEQDAHRKRLIATVAATVISLACGTNYVYSAWAPQFAEKLRLSTTESNLIGLFGNLGMYTLGIPIGMFVDDRGSRPAVLAGAFFLAIGYIPLCLSFEKAAGSVPVLCFFSYLTGLGGCMAFAGAVKTSALNWPSHRGTATAFPLAGFGLSAFFFSFLGAVFFPGSTSSFLMLLAWGSFGLTFSGYFFLKVYPQVSYQEVPTQAPASQPSRERARSITEPGTSSNPDAVDPNLDTSSPGTPPAPDASRAAIFSDTEAGEDAPIDETSTLMPEAVTADIVGRSSVDQDVSHRVDIRGVKLLFSLDFWQLFSMMAILAGTGLMTINNIGNDANALWKHYDPSVDEPFLVSHQQIHVSILSVFNFVGRLLSGIGSDYLVRTLRASRIWCLAVACLVFLLAQICALQIEMPQKLVFVSGLSGLAYGFLFGVFPSIVAETFGIRGLSQNWGFMMLAPVVSGNVFNLLYGRIYDHHSIVEPDGTRSCDDGIACYRGAYTVTATANALGLILTLYIIHHQRARYLKGKDNGIILLRQLLRCSDVLHGLIATRIAYALLLLVNSILAWIMLTDWAIEKLQHLALDYVKINCPTGQCYGWLAAHRINFALGLLHLIFAGLLFGVRSSKNPRAAIQNGYWGPKIIAWLALIVMSFLIPDKFFMFWGNYVSFGAAMLFLILGLILLVDLAHTWAEYCLGQIEETDSRVWRIVLVGSTLGMYLASIAMTVVQYIFFAQGSCTMNQTAITVNLILWIIISIVSVNPTVQEYNPKAGLAQAAMVAVYCTYLTMSAVSMEPDDKNCNPLVRAQGTRTTSVVIGAIVTMLTVAYTTTRAATQSLGLGGNGNGIQLPEDDEHDLVTQQPIHRREMRAEALRRAVEEGSLPADALLSDDESDDGANHAHDDERASTQYNYSMFHIIFFLATAWVSTLLTLNFEESTRDGQFATVGRTYGASWVKIVSAWICHGMYIWTLVAPILLPERFDS
ncbi:serine incorporator domain-containing protein [Trichoderma sp. SZMC 28015]